MFIGVVDLCVKAINKRFLNADVKQVANFVRFRNFLFFLQDQFSKPSPHIALPTNQFFSLLLKAVENQRVRLFCKSDRNSTVRRAI